MSKLFLLLKILAVTLPFLLTVYFGNKANLKKTERYKQCYMPFVALVFCIVAGVFSSFLSNIVFLIIGKIAVLLNSFAEWLGGIFSGNLEIISELVYRFARFITRVLKSSTISFWLAIAFNSFVAICYVIFKSFLIRIVKLFYNKSKNPLEPFTSLVYEKDEHSNARYVRKDFTQAVILTKALYITTIIFSVIGLVVSSFMYRFSLMASIYYPILSVILVGEIFFYLNGNFREQKSGSLEGENDDSGVICDYTLMRKILRRTFGDKLLSENTEVNCDMFSYKSVDDIITGFEDSDDFEIELYGRFMRKAVGKRADADRNYLMSGLDLLRGKSILFNNPFYYDLIPYIFYPMNNTILKHKKVLVVLGRHAIEDSITDWLRKGFSSVNHIPTLWDIQVLDENEKNPDVGIITRSSVHDLKLHEANSEFFSQVDFVILIEPSKLIPTAQIGLNSIVRYCRTSADKKLVYCSVDKNCDGMVDALSHILMTSLQEVSATNHPGGTSSYMCWDVDNEHLQHRLLPNLSRYLGFGTELSFAALKNQVSVTKWYGGETFPVIDIHWIAKQYHYDLLSYASLPALQSVLDEVFIPSAGMWDASIQDRNYITVEDEYFNMYEIKRDFSTRARTQGFVNVISSDYMLKEYMANNDSIFNADSKAVPYIVADYADTEKNLIYRICMRLCSGQVLEKDLERELGVLDLDTTNISRSIWKGICKTALSAEHADASVENIYELELKFEGKTYIFTPDVINKNRAFSYKSGKMETFYSITDSRFINAFLGDLCSAQYISEDETEQNQFLGTELRGHIFQKYLPGQFFTFGGKYYEMRRLSADGKVVVRRAADHINGRPQYRQVRKYTLRFPYDSKMMGDVRDIGGIKITKQYADITVETPAYWLLKRYNDFKTGKLVSINGVPSRSYNNKQILKIDFDGVSVTPEIIKTLVLLINESFRTLYADNQSMIVAVCANGDDEQLSAPHTMTLEGDVSKNSIYIIEDSRLDIGLLISAERNLGRVLTIICDYLNWHFDALDISLNPPPEPEPEEVPLTEPIQEKAENGGIQKVKKAAGKVAGFFKNLFRKKSKEEKERIKQEKKAKKEAEKAEKAAKKAEKAAAKAAKKAEKNNSRKSKPDGDGNTVAENAPDDAEIAIDTPADGENSDGAIQDAEDGMDGSEETADAAEKVETKDTTSDDEELDTMLMDISPSYNGNTESEQEEEVPQDEQNGQQETPSGEEDSDSPSSAEENPDNAEPEISDVEFDTDTATVVKGAFERTRKPYHECCYLYYGGEQVPETVDIRGALDFLEECGYGNGFLEQARKGKVDSARDENSYDPERPGSRFCDFCGAELTGTEYEVLNDGRERCNFCSKTVIKTEEDFIKLYTETVKNMKTFYNVSITEPVHIKMVDSKKLHRKLGKSFVPSPKADGRILGVAIKSKDGYTILLENGAPRIKACMTMVHELTHIWQYINWDTKAIRRKFGKKLELPVYEGMAKWSEIQYAYLINQPEIAKREQIITLSRDDEYGHGFTNYVARYPISESTTLTDVTPFDFPENPL